jgi:hypothetical protein
VGGGGWGVGGGGGLERSAVDSGHIHILRGAVCIRWASRRDLGCLAPCVIARVHPPADAAPWGRPPSPQSHSMLLSLFCAARTWILYLHLPLCRSYAPLLSAPPPLWPPPSVGHPDLRSKRKRPMRMRVASLGSTTSMGTRIGNQILLRKASPQTHCKAFGASPRTGAIASGIRFQSPCELLPLHFTKIEAAGLLHNQTTKPSSQICCKLQSL